ncbi:MAG: hypothetical protein HY709_01810, partial [Candidatus Latescibacteria bacterium]|nr:hypothetical protein [Candidatus Latescibacterota bacterium]
MIAGGSGHHYTPVYYKYSLPGSYDEKWGFELMWQPMEDIRSGRARSLYYYNLKGGRFNRDSGTFTIQRRLAPWSAQVAEVRQVPER